MSYSTSIFLLKLVEKDNKNHLKTKHNSKLCEKVLLNRVDSKIAQTDLNIVNCFIIYSIYYLRANNFIKTKKDQD